jgi:hypothetical protein
VDNYNFFGKNCIILFLAIFPIQYFNNTWGFICHHFLAVVVQTWVWSKDTIFVPHGEKLCAIVRVKLRRRICTAQWRVASHSTHTKDVSDHQDEFGNSGEGICGLPGLKPCIPERTTEAVYAEMFPVFLEFLETIDFIL